MSNQFVADFCAGPAGPPTDCSDGGTTPAQNIAAHASFNFTNNFNFVAVGPTSSAVTAAQSLTQQTAVKNTNIGSLATPNPAGDQIFTTTTSWNTTSANPSSNNPATGPTNLTVTWSQSISDPDQSGTGTGAFQQDIRGTFVYNGTSAAISAQYPNGQTQTLRSTGATSPVGETLDFPSVP